MGGVRVIRRGFGWGNGKFRIGGAIVLFLVLTALVHGLILHVFWPGANPLSPGAYGDELPMSWVHPLGTGRFGSDWLAVLINAIGYSLEVAAIAGVVSTAFGVLVAFVGGYRGGTVDSVLRTVTDMFLVIPSLPLLLTLANYLHGGLSLPDTALLLSIFSWPFAARTIRSQVLTLRSKPYVDLARMSGCGALEIIVRELLPNLVPYIGVGLANAALGAVFALVGLEVIGLGPSALVDLGMMINLAINWGVLSLGDWWLFAAPVVVLSLLFVGLNLVNFGLEETFNPRLRPVSGQE